MQFASVAYLAFLAGTVAIYFALPGPRTRTVWLLAASLGFYYSLSARWTLALVAVVLIGYVDALVIERVGEARTKRHALWIGVGLVLGILAVFKYTAFAASLVDRGLAFAGSPATVPLLRLALPVGISFWTFSTISYLVDVARGTRPSSDPCRGTRCSSRSSRTSPRGRSRAPVSCFRSWRSSTASTTS